MLEIVDGGAFPQEFRVGDHGEIVLGPQLADDPLDLVAGTDRHSRLGDDHGEAPQRRRDLAGGLIDIGQIGMAVAAAGRGADCDEHHIGHSHRFAERCAERQPPLLDIGANDLADRARRSESHLH